MRVRARESTRERERERVRENESYKITRESCNDLCNFPLSLRPNLERGIDEREFVDRVTYINK